MDDEKRIEELEAEVRELTGIVRRLMDARQPAAAPPDEQAGESATAAAASREPRGPDLMQGMQRVLGGEPGETLESRIGGIWLSRVALLVVATTLVVGARVTLGTQVLLPIHKILIGYGVALAAAVYGLFPRKESDAFAHAALGGGLATLYFSTYAVFFVEGAALFPGAAAAFPSLAVCLLLVMAIAHWRKSETVAGMALFLAYFTVVLSCMHGKNGENIVYALGTCALLAAGAMVFHAVHRWLVLTWGALVTTYVTYFYFFLRKPPGLMLSDREYFWVSGGFLALCYVLFSCAAILDARKTGEYRRTVAPMAGMNSFIFFALTWAGIRLHYVEYEWVFRLCFTLMLLTFAILAETTGPKRNYLFQIFVAKTVIMFTLALQAYFSGEKLIVAMALESLALAFSYKRSGVVSFKALGMALMFVTFVSCLLTVKDTRPLAFGPLTMRANWFAGIGASSVYLVVAWFFEHHVRRFKPDKRVVSGQWFLADSLLDVHNATAAMFHAAAAAFILLTLTIIDQGEQAVLPYLLGGEAVAIAAAGFVLRTPQVEAASVLLLAAAHVCYHVFLQFDVSGFDAQPFFALYTVLLALFTYLGAHLWERYLRRVQGGKPWEHDVAAAVPYLAATFLLTTLMAHSWNRLDTALGQNALGVALLVIAALTRFSGMKASGLMALGFGSAACYAGLYAPGAAIHRLPHFLPLFALVLATYAGAERAFVAAPHGVRYTPTPADNVFRSLLVAVAVVLGLLGLAAWATESSLTRYWFALGLAMIAAGAVFRESRYRWAALTIIAIVIGRAFFFDLWNLPPFYQFLSFAAMAVPLLVISRAYSARRRRMIETRNENTEDSTPGG